MTTENQATNPFATADSFREHLGKIQAEAVKVDVINVEPKEIKNDEPINEKADVREQEAAEVANEGGDGDDEGHTSEVNKTDNLEKEPRLIPKSRLKQETEKRRQSEELLFKEREERLREKEEYIRKLSEFQPKEKVQPIAQEPDLDQLDALDQDAHRIYAKRIKDLERKIAEVEQSSNQKADVLFSQNILKAQKSEFEKKNPDFQEAYDFATQRELQLAKLYFKRQDPRKSEEVITEQAQVAVNQRFSQLAYTEAQNRRDAAELFYDMAKAHGYTKREEEDEREQTHEAPRVDIDAINRNKKKTASISNIGQKINLGGNKGNIVDFSQCLRDPKNPSSGIDPVKFAQYRQRLAKNAS